MSDQLTPSQIKAARAALGWTRQTLADAAGVHPATVKNYERGKIATPVHMTALKSALAEGGAEFANGRLVI